MWFLDDSTSMSACRFFGAFNTHRVGIGTRLFSNLGRVSLRSIQQFQDVDTTSTRSLLEDYKKSLQFPQPSNSHINSPSRTRRQELIPWYKYGHESRKITLHGYLGHCRTPSKSLAFVEFYGPERAQSIQLVSIAKVAGLEIHDLVRHSRAGTAVVIEGNIQPKSALTEEEKQLDSPPNEIILSNLQILNTFPSDIDSGASLGPDQRHLQLKFGVELRNALRFRDETMALFGKWLRANDYIHVETPQLFKATSEGAREFLVPTRRDGLAYALPQSPQQYKQILVAGGIPSYFQFARCFRDEDMRADRQPEFTQLDLERAFATGKDIMHDVEAMVKDLLNVSSIPLADRPETTFPVLTYKDAMAKYGIDKPDLRLSYKIARIEHLIPVDLVRMISPLNLPAVDITLLRLSDSPTKTREFVAGFLDSVDGKAYLDNPDGGPGIFIYDSKKPLSGLQAFGFEAAEEVERQFEPEEGDLIILQARTDEDFHGGSTALGRIMVDLNRAAVQNGLKQLSTDLRFLWVTDFPLFSPSSKEEPGQSGSAGIQSTHHPFTSPKSPEDVDLLLSNPRAAIADHYDLVLNGVEIGGGSRRIHNAEVQRFVMEEVLKMPASKVQEFDHLLEALRAGCPPHAGFALGFDRFIAVLLGKDSVRDVIAFPKVGKGDDPMVKSPAKVSVEAWDVYKLQPKA